MKSVATVLVFFFASCATLRHESTIDTHAVAAAIGKEGSLQAGNVYKVTFPRSDLQAVVQGTTIRPALAFTSWVAFLPASEGALMMGDLVLSEDEVVAAIEQLQRAGLRQTALHNHVLGEKPRSMYLHIEGHGDPVALARGVREALGVTKTSLHSAPSREGPSDLPTSQLDEIIGVPGRSSAGVYQFSIPRRETIRAHGITIPPSMGVATVINFQPTTAGTAATTGDFVLLGSEVNLVIRELTRNGIAVTALHSHMLDESPRLFFLHFWAEDNPLRLARSLASALAQTNSER